MQAKDDQSAFEWIREARARLDLPNRPKPSPDWPGILVSDLIPGNFEAFAKVLHRFDASYKEIDHPLSSSEKALLKIPDCEPLSSFVVRRRDTSPTRRIRWKELAALLSVPYAPEINYNWFRLKIDGWCLRQHLDSPGAWPVGDECEEVCSALKRFSETEECFFRISDHMMYSFPEKPQMFTGSLQEVVPFLKTQANPWFEYWWPADHRWCLCYDDDVSVTLIGGSRQLISCLASSSVLECIEVKATTRVDDRVPMPEIAL
jgi:hypothetical protein